MPEIAGTSIALAVVVISIILAGIAIGLGRAFGYKRLERFGLEELGQAIINAALVGAIVGIVTLLSSVSATLIATPCADGNPISELGCAFASLHTTLFSFLQEGARTLEILGYYQSLVLDFGLFSIQPLTHFDSPMRILSDQLAQLQFLLMLAYLQSSLIAFLQENAFLYLLSAGLIFRAFFATRKFGAFLLALFLSLYILYPVFILLSPLPGVELAAAIETLKTFNENPFYATPPLLDLNDAEAVAEKLDEMSLRINATGNDTAVSNDVTGDLSAIVQSNARALGMLWIYLVVAPLVSLVLVAVLVRELAAALSAEIGFSPETV